MIHHWSGKISEDIRDTEKMKIKCAEMFFEKLKIDGYDVRFRKQMRNQDIKNVIDDVLAGE